MSQIDVVVGAAYGSEGKGHITAQLVHRRLHDEERDVLNVRVAGPNAGHTVIDEWGNSFALRAIPVGAAIDDDVWLYIAPGSEFELQVVLDELHLLRSKGHSVSKLYVSGEATLLEEYHKEAERVADMSGRIGSTAKGIGAARSDRIWRNAKRVMDSPETIQILEEVGVGVVDTRLAEREVPYINRFVNLNNVSIIVEGTQGYGLGLHSGDYPQVTSSDARAIDFLAMAGISPWAKAVEHISVWLVARVFPIRVAGNSGPMKGETGWDELGLPEEHTTVTKKVRRVGAWDPALIRAAVVANGGGQVTTRASVVVALTMVDQMFPGVKSYSSGELMTLKLEAKELKELKDFMAQVEFDAQAPIACMSTSDRTVIWR
jgi:adenylosuccinate synthase